MARLINTEPRQDSLGRRVFVYRNLRKRCYSIRAAEGTWKGLVIAHAERVEVDDVSFKVSEAGRQRVLRTGVKNVHAGVEGRLIRFIAMDWRSFDLELVPDRPTGYWRIARYDPRMQGYFFDAVTGNAVEHSDYVVMTPTIVSYFAG